LSTATAAGVHLQERETPWARVSGAIWLSRCTTSFERPGTRAKGNPTGIPPALRPLQAFRPRRFLLQIAFVLHGGLQARDVEVVLDIQFQA
jgi:hypothetical protein